MSRITVERTVIASPTESSGIEIAALAGLGVALTFVHEGVRMHVILEGQYEALQFGVAVIQAGTAAYLAHREEDVEKPVLKRIV